MVESISGEPLHKLRQIGQASAGRMTWGYTGSGPFDTAFSILVDAVGDDAICSICKGTYQVVYVAEGDGYRPEPFDPVRHQWTTRGWTCTCAHGYSHLPAGEFCDQFVDHWGDEWRISRSDVLAWLEERNKRQA